MDTVDCKKETVRFFIAYCEGLHCLWRGVIILCLNSFLPQFIQSYVTYEGWNFNSGNYLFTTDTK